ncbi:AcrR family transcriptional regulator [Amycolatopsis bartoniae]|uniref:TetR family transcriptional regulator n=1 Tax=Amycolatopsis bartoniae TaxID=941986 RepID=A0A8H9M9B8_9PSEU|nr:TetR family transcriptional regulator [Amycolatopsis bartoniae]MBB2934341.1 AcrR family transcriptional regulator [Amycolatopsis bartoniae]TVT00182.1 TetR family transcriptional regulator [Amycolatopsis bartoniae]GHF48052.1 TetR family transcriptional regulator [Amycolatopsis bartoniae]
MQVRSFTAEARRTQIVGATIEVIAEVGYPQASFSRIAERAGLSSTRLISYHFAGKKELIEQVVAELYTEIGGFMTERVERAESPREALHAYIEGYAEFVAGHRTQMKALLSIFLNGGLEYDPAEQEVVVLSPLERIVGDGQAAGVFRQCDARVAAAAVQRALDGLPMMLETSPDLDVTAAARELVELFDRGLRA